MIYHYIYIFLWYSSIPLIVTQVLDLRHGIEGVSKMAARQYVAKHTEDHDKIRIAMIHLSAHGEDTSDAVYAGEENTMFNLTHEDIDMYR